MEQPGRPARTARLAGRVVEVWLVPPVLPRAVREQRVPPPPPQRVRVLEARELDATGKDPFLRTLLTTLPVRTAAEATQRVRSDPRRWVLADLQRRLKSGLQAERLQFDDADSLRHALARL